MVFYHKGVVMDIWLIERNNKVLKKTIKYLDGQIKEEVEEVIIKNDDLIDTFIDEMAEEYNHVTDYENNS
jgi:hypothetical protein